MAGYPLTALDINSRAGTLARAAWDALDEVNKFKLWLDDADHTDTALGPTGVGVTSPDLVIIRASFTDLSNLYKVSHGLQATGVSNFFSNAKKLGGIYYTA